MTGLVSPMRTMRGLPGRQGSGRGGAARAYPDGVPLTGSNYIWAPDANPLDITGDLEIVIKVAPTSWTASEQVLVAKEQSTSTRTFRFAFTTASKPYLAFSIDGSTPITALSANAVAFSAAETAWLKVTRASATGSVVFSTATNQASEPSSWTPLSTVASTSGALFSGSSILEVGARSGGTVQRLTGNVFRVIVRNGIGGSTVADFDSQLSGRTGYTDAFGNVWTIT